MWRRIVLGLVVIAMSSGTVFSYEQYVEDVVSGNQTVCRWTRLAVERHLRDLERQNTTEFPFYFDHDEARRSISFAHQLQHSQGFTGSLRLESWQQFGWASTFGWRRQSDGLRRFTKIYREVARKNGKTFEAAAMVNYAWHAEKEPGPEAYCLAVDREQAKKPYSEIVKQNLSNPSLARRVREYRTGSGTLVKLKDTAAFIRPVPRDAKRQDSWNPYVILVDEYHAHPTNELINVFESGMGARRRPLTIIITTAGTNLQGPAFEEERSALTRILDGTVSPAPEHYWGIIYTLDDGDDYNDRSVWPKANPNIGVSFNEEYLDQRIQEAVISPRKLSDVLTKNFNMWLQSDTRWLNDNAWMGCDSPVNEESLRGRDAFGGLDLASHLDITALAWAFPPTDAEMVYQLVWRFFIPESFWVGSQLYEGEAGIIKRSELDRVPYRDWWRSGHVIATPGDVIDYAFVEDVIREDMQKFNIREAAYDPWNASEITSHLEDSLDLVQYRQSYGTMSPATKTFERLVMAQQVAHGGHPVSRWMMSNTEIKSDRQDNIMPMKPKRDVRGKRIDGIVAAIMALHRAALHKESESSYERRGVRTLG